MSMKTQLRNYSCVNTSYIVDSPIDVLDNSYQDVVENSDFTIIIVLHLIANIIHFILIVVLYGDITATRPIRGNVTDGYNQSAEIISPQYLYQTSDRRILFPDVRSCGRQVDIDTGLVSTVHGMLMYYSSVSNSYDSDNNYCGI